MLFNPENDEQNQKPTKKGVRKEIFYKLVVRSPKTEKTSE